MTNEIKMGFVKCHDPVSLCFLSQFYPLREHNTECLLNSSLAFQCKVVFFFFKGNCRLTCSGRIMETSCMSFTCYSKLEYLALIQCCTVTRILSLRYRFTLIKLPQACSVLCCDFKAQECPVIKVISHN